VNGAVIKNAQSAWDCMAIPRWLKPGREAALKRAGEKKPSKNPPAEAGGKEERAEAR
jgi:hypothetical protein